MESACLKVRASVSVNSGLNMGISPKFYAKKARVSGFGETSEKTFDPNASIACAILKFTGLPKQLYLKTKIVIYHIKPLNLSLEGKWQP